MTSIPRLLFLLLILGLAFSLPGEEMSEQSLLDLKSDAYDFYYQRRFSEAEPLFRKYLHLVPDDDLAAIEFAQLLSGMERHAEAAEILEKIHLKIPEHETAYFHLGLEYKSISQLEKAEKIFQQLESSGNSDMATAAHEALLTLYEEVERLEREKREQQIFELSRLRKNREALQAIEDLEKRGKISWFTEMERMYLLQRLEKPEEALLRALPYRDSHSRDSDFIFLLAGLLAQNEQPDEAVRILKMIQKDNPGTSTARIAEKQIQLLPASADSEKKFWGETALNLDYYGRFGNVIGSGTLTEGTFIPHARWLQPYLQFHFLKDTVSQGASNGDSAATGLELGQGSVVSENLIGFNLGIRAQPFPMHTFQIYVSGGPSQDLLDIRHQGDWFADFQAGINGYESFGPGGIFWDTPDPEAETSQSDDPLKWVYPWSKIKTPPAPLPLDSWLWRGDWFIEGGGDFSYYRRLADWIGSAEIHEGFRIAQYRSLMAWDAYFEQNITFDSRGSFFDNFTEFGPGTRWIWNPVKNSVIIINAQWLNGYYLGRDDLGTRNIPSNHYNELRIDLSLTTRW